MNFETNLKNKKDFGSNAMINENSNHLNSETNIENQKEKKSSSDIIKCSEFEKKKK